VRNSSLQQPRKPRSAACGSTQSQDVAQLGSQARGTGRYPGKVLKAPVPKSLMEGQIESAQFLAAIAEPGDEVQPQFARHEQRGGPDLREVIHVIDRDVHGFPRGGRQLDTPDIRGARGPAGKTDPRHCRRY